MCTYCTIEPLGKNIFLHLFQEMVDKTDVVKYEENIIHLSLYEFICFEHLFFPSKWIDLARDHPPVHILSST